MNIEPLPWLNRLFNRISFTLFQIIFKSQACPTYGRSFLHHFLTNRKIRKVTKEHPEADFHLFLSYRFWNIYSEKPSVLWCDWPDSTVVERIGRKAAWYEKASLQRECRAIQNADRVYSMFPCCAKDMKHKYGRDVQWLGRNVVNTMEDTPPDMAAIIAQRCVSKKILFIGGYSYRGACQSLIDTFAKIKSKTTDIQLHIVGQRKENFTHLSQNIHFHGYLRKDIAGEREKYYNLLKSARVLVNPASKWGGYSSTIEAMYYWCPIIVSPYNDFTEEFGKLIPFGYYLNRQEQLQEKMEQMISMAPEEYEKMAYEAHNAVKEYTWENYVKCFLADLEDSGIIR